MHLGRLERYFMCPAAVVVCACVVSVCLENDALYVHIVHAFLWFCRVYVVVFLAAFCCRSYFWQLNACGDGEDDDDGSCLVGCYVACRILSVIISPRASSGSSQHFFLTHRLTPCRNTKRKK